MTARAYGDAVRVAVMVSGAGSNMVAIADALVETAHEVVAVISDQNDPGAFAKARALGLPTHVVAWSEGRSAATHAVCELLDELGVELVVLAGFMRILGPEAVERYGGRIVNIHPSLLPSFPGRDAVGQALSAGVPVTGVTVHFVDEQVDHGPVIVQRPVPVLTDDTPESLHARIQEVEHVLYPAVVLGLCNGEFVFPGVPA